MWKRSLFVAAALGAQAALAGTVTLNPSKDNTIWYDPNIALSNGAGEFMFVGTNSGGQFRRGLMAFDLSALPTNAQVTDASLTVNADKAQLSSTTTLHKLTTDWGEGASDSGDPGGSGAPSVPPDASWFYNFYNTSMWTTPGGDFVATPSASAGFGVGSATFTDPQMLADVEAWQANPATNFGWMLIGDESGPFTAKRIDTRENPTPENRPALAITYNASTWKTSGGAWSNAANWNFGVPGGAGAEANFTFASGSGSIAVNIDGARTVGSLNFASTNEYALSGSAISLDRASGHVAITVTQGSHVIQSALNFNKATDIDVEGGAALVVSGSLSSSGVAINKTGDGSLTVPTLRATDVNIGGGKITVAQNGGDSGVSYVNTLLMDPAAALDLLDNDLVVNNGDFNTIQALVFNGYRQGVDPNATGIVSSTGQTAAGNPILAVFDNSLVGAGDYPFGSGHTIEANAVVGKYTYIGDTNWDGEVTPDDYGALDANLGTTNVPAGTAWFMGDTNFDAQVTPDDYGALDANLGLGTAQPLATNGGAAVPEPGVIGAIAAGAVGLMTRRRKIRR